MCVDRGLEIRGFRENLNESKKMWSECFGVRLCAWSCSVTLESYTIFSFLHSQSHHVGRGRMNTQRTRRRILSKFDLIVQN
jgi:hypothetical protein